MALPSPPLMLPDDAVGEILRRLPPDEPACLVRASLVCKSWRLLISEPDFLLRYHELHPTPLVLGFLYNNRFIPTTATNPPLFPLEFDYFDWLVVELVGACNSIFGSTKDEDVVEDASVTWVSV
ncbi:uncharacterized protein [Setaria viridis]|uniref:uncharacterized protein n=1 Tax=Setaria viridis TaxID=4556 RepID=UPI003B3A7037